jgi:hypothetical protein
MARDLKEACRVSAGSIAAVDLRQELFAILPAVDASEVMQD